MDGGSGRRGKGSGGGCKGFGSGGVSGRGTGPRDGANFATCVVFLLTRTKRRTPCPSVVDGGSGRRGKGSGGGCKGFGSGGVGTEQISQRVSYFCHF